MLKFFFKIFNSLIQNLIYLFWLFYTLCVSWYIYNLIIIVYTYKFRFEAIEHYRQSLNFAKENEERLITFLVIFTLSIIFSITPIGEKLLRFLENVRSLYTKKEKEYLLPIFDDVYNKAISANYKIKKIEMCVVDAMYVNAYALGGRTVAVTTGAINTLSEEELKALIAHEIGHIINGHTIAVLFSTIGNGILLFPIILAKMYIKVTETLYSKYKGAGIITLCIYIVKVLCNTLLFLCVYISELILSINSRSNEYIADEFAYDIGYGTELINALYLIQGMIISDKANLWDKLKRSHPNIAKRIGNLEKIRDKEEKLSQSTK